MAGVAEGVGDESLGGDGGDGLVEVLHLDRVQGDVDDVAVGVELGHLDPVTDADDVVAGDLHAGHQGEQGVLEDQQQHRGHGAEAGEQDQRRAVDQGGDHQDDRDGVDDDLADLDIALDRLEPRRGPARIEHVDHVEGAAQGQGDGQHDEGAADVLYHGDQGLGTPGHQFDADRQHQGRDDVGQPTDDAVVIELLVLTKGGAAQQAIEAAHQDALDDPVEHPGRQQQAEAGDQGEQLRVFFEVVDQVGQGRGHRGSLDGILRAPR